MRDTGRNTNIRCPLHDDRQASLNVWKTPDGWVHFKCMANSANCSEAALETHAGLAIADRAPLDSGYKNGNGNGSGFDAFTARIICTYPYLDESGKLLFESVRFTAPKDFRQRRPDPQRPDYWLWRLDDTRRVLYRLPAVVAAVKARTPIWIVEGEKDVASCEARGLVATTNPGGAGKWKPEYSQTLAGAAITIVADNDEPGIDHAKKIANSLKAVGVRSWRIVQALSGKDATDHFDAGHGVEDFVLMHGDVVAPPKPPPPASPELPQSPYPFSTAGFPQTDHGNAERFEELYGQDVRYVTTQGKWYCWDGTRFRPDDAGDVQHLAALTTRGILNEAAAQVDLDQRRALNVFARKSDNAAPQSALLRIAQHRPALKVPGEALDRDPYFLNLANGTLDLRTGDLHPHTRADLLTRMTGDSGYGPAPSYDTQAACPTWDDFLWRVLEENSALVRYVQKAVGYTLTGDAKEECLFIAYGSGANGKSTFLRVLGGLMGEYATGADPTTVLDSGGSRNGGEHRADLLALIGNRLVTITEVPEGKKFNAGLIKAVTGRDKMSVRGAYEKQQVVFRAGFKLWFAVNHLPVIQDETEGMWRRLRVIPFTVTIPEAERDGDLDQKLCAEWPGILNWALQGVRAWQSEGLGAPVEVREATNVYREQSDDIAGFIADACTVADNARSTTRTMYRAFIRWAKESGVDVVSEKRFSQRLQERGYVKGARRGSGIPWYGVAPREVEKEEAVTEGLFHAE